MIETAHPPFHDWPDLAEAAARLHADRRAGDPQAVEAARITPAQADNRDRVARALVAILRFIIAREDVPHELPATIAEIRADLALAPVSAARLAAARPSDRALAQHAARLATLARHFAPIPIGDTPSILFCHAVNQQARAERAARSSPNVANEGGAHVAQTPTATAGQGSAQPQARFEPARPAKQAALL